jgi:hypothetical protein
VLTAAIHTIAILLLAVLCAGIGAVLWAARQLRHIQRVVVESSRPEGDHDAP